MHASLSHQMGPEKDYEHPILENMAFKDAFLKYFYKYLFLGVLREFWIFEALDCFSFKCNDVISQKNRNGLGCTSPEPHKVRT